jgi:hypothetical protein
MSGLGSVGEPFFPLFPLKNLTDREEYSKETEDNQQRTEVPHNPSLPSRMIPHQKTIPAITSAIMM